MTMNPLTRDAVVSISLLAFFFICATIGAFLHS